MDSVDYTENARVRFGRENLVPAIFFFLCYTAVGAFGLGLSRGGFMLLAPVFLVFGALPLLDEFLGDDRSPGLRGGPRASYDLPLRLFVPVQLAVLAFACHEAPSLAGPWSLAALILATGTITGACGITIAHELMHRPGRLEQGLAEILMGSVGYGHFTTEHVFGHHRRVATPVDPASARLGESYYTFLPRTVIEGVRSGFRLEAGRVRALGHRAWSLSDGRLRWILLSLGFAISAALIGGPSGVLLFLGQSAVAVLLLELINYLEHYGLERTIDEQGRPERVRLSHSWNSARLLSGVFLFRLTRHSEHHFDATRPYEQLPPGEVAPRLPAGYASMLLLALVPPLWFRVMNPRVLALRTSRV